MEVTCRDCPYFKPFTDEVMACNRPPAGFLRQSNYSICNWFRAELGIDGFTIDMGVEDWKYSEFARTQTAILNLAIEVEKLKEMKKRERA